MTLESSLPWISVAAALAAGVFAGGIRPSSAETGLKALALAALAMFAYFRGVAPAAVAQALVLGAIAQALAPRGVQRFATAGVLFLAAAWLVFAYLFFRTGGGQGAPFTDPVRTVLLVCVLSGVAFVARRTRREGRRARTGALADLAALTLVAWGALTLPWTFWPAMAGTAAVLAGEALLMETLRPDAPETGPLVRRAAWTLSYLGLAAMAYPFLR